MTNRGSRRWLDWRLFDGAISISASTWLGIGLSQCDTCAGWPLVGFLSRLAATNETGIIVVATALLFPTAASLLGGVFVFFAAKDAAERWSQRKDAKAEARGREAGRKEGLAVGVEKGREEGRDEGRDEVIERLNQLGFQLPPDILDQLNGKNGLNGDDKPKQ